MIESETKLDDTIYKKGTKIIGEILKNLSIVRNEFHSE
jgi:hypothetical protein